LHRETALLPPMLETLRRQEIRHLPLPRVGALPLGGRLKLSENRITATVAVLLLTVSPAESDTATQ
jgi:hypothetical protein